MKRLLSTLLLAGVVLWSASQAMAFKPAVVFDMGGKFTSHLTKEFGTDWKSSVKKPV